jgi:type IV pilus assembly protein PilQ
MRRIVVFILSLVLATLLCAGQVSVRGVELLEGDHVVQVRFVTSEPTPPIPEIVEKAGNRLELVSPDLAFQLSQSQYLFDSALVKSVLISAAGVEIVLHTKAQYRLFSNGDGLFVEFQKGAAMTAPSSRKETAPTAPASPNLAVSVKASGNDSVQLLLRLPRETAYDVIPVEQEPCRLAIDLKGIRAAALKETVDLFNVKKVRGGYNSPEVYRVVFDLAFFTPYRVKSVEEGLLVEFYQKTAAAEPVALAVQTVQPDQKALPSEKSVTLAAPVEEPFFKEEAALSQPAAQQEESVVGDDRTAVQNMSGVGVIQSGETAYTGEVADFVFKNADLVNVLKMIAKIAELNLVVNPGVSGRVTSELVQVPWDQALDIFLKINGLDKVVEGNILRIGKVEELAKEAEQRRRMLEARETDVRLEVMIRPLSYAKAADVKKILDTQLSKRGEIQVDIRSNSLVISEVPDRIKILDRLIASLDVSNQQVSIEAKIVESKQTNESALGIKWGYSGAMSPQYGNQTSLKFPNSISSGGELVNGYAINLPVNSTKAPTTAVGITFGNVAGSFNLDAVLSVMESKGWARVLSSPKTTVQNNMMAEIVNGSKVPVQAMQPNGTYTVRYINAALELRVTPQITAEGTIITDIEINNDKPDWDATKRVMGNPPIDTQSVKNTVQVKDGGTIVIGGLYQIASNQGTDSVPLLSKIPLLGNLFKNRNKKSEKFELLIFVTPRIIK